MRLDRLIAKHRHLGRECARRMLVEGRVLLNGVVVLNGHVEVSRFCEVRLEGEEVQAAQRALYVMMHKPAGLLSATKDAIHRTVLDVINDPDKETLHLAGRLDRASTGLLLLTNDGAWSKQLMAAEHKVPKVYEVRTDVMIPADAVEAFERGFYFHTEGITTLPAQLEITSECTARVTLHEGRYHQVKRMFHRVGCRVLALHRTQIGSLQLPHDLAPGAWRQMTEMEKQAACESAIG
jgi:16S rRNA pseudouridine516 synthase